LHLEKSIIFMEVSLNGCVVLVTGASRGIGQACAIALAREGCNVALAARTEAGLQVTADLCRAANSNCRCLVLPVDLCVKQNLGPIVDRCVAELGGINILVANAGIYSSDIETAFSLNALSAFRLTELASPYIRRDAASRRSGIVFVGSLASRLTFRGGAAFCASKHAILGYSGCVFEDLREEGIKVCSILPGFVNTAMVTSRSSLDKALMIQPSDIASTVTWILTFPDSSCPTEIVVRPQRTPYKPTGPPAPHS
jgi:NAD(P)-dependent dehydrogenase (short-subunit alcohol dehydrogenase family)